MSLKDEHPVPDNNNKQDWQNVLAIRWNKMRDYVANNGTISIKFR